MTAWESGSWALACSMGTSHTLIEESIFPTWYRQRLIVSSKVIADIGEVALSYLVYPRCQVIILRTSNWQQDKNDVIDKERCQDYECGTSKLLITIQEII